MTAGVKVSGAWRTIVGAYVRVGGIWKQAPTIGVKVAGVWKSIVVVASITIPVNWGSSTGAGTRTSSAQATTVPAGNSGSVQIVSSASSGVPVFTYRQNSTGLFQALPTGADNITVVNGQNLELRMAGASGSVGSFTVNDLTTGAVVGTFTATIT